MCSQFCAKMKHGKGFAKKRWNYTSEAVTFLRITVNLSKTRCCKFLTAVDQFWPSLYARVAEWREQTLLSNKGDKTMNTLAKMLVECTKCNMAQGGQKWSKMVTVCYSKDGKVLVASNKLENRRVRVSRPLLAHVQPPSSTSQYTALCHASFCCAVVQPNVLHMFIDLHPSSCATKCTSHVHWFSSSYLIGVLQAHGN